MHCRSRISFGLSSDQPWLLPSFIHAQQTQTLCFSSIREEEKEEEETKKVVLTVKDKKMKKNVSLSTLNSSVNTEIHGRRRRRSVKVIGLGTRASNALQFCRESSLLPSAELWYAMFFFLFVISLSICIELMVCKYDVFIISNT